MRSRKSTRKSTCLSRNMKRTGVVAMQATATMTSDVVVTVDTMAVAAAAATEVTIAVIDGADVRYAKKYGSELPRIPVIRC